MFVRNQSAATLLSNLRAYQGEVEPVLYAKLLKG
jgi:hypothetical protein